MKKLIKYVLTDIVRNRIVLAYTLFLLMLSCGIFLLEDNSSKGLLSLLNIVLIIVPLVSMLFPAIYVYNSAEFMELLVSQPLRRSVIWKSLYGGLSISLSAAFFIGVGIPILIFESSGTGIAMLLCGLALSVIFTGIAMLCAVTVRDKARGIGASILLWLYFAVLFDAIVLFILFQYADYPLEKPMIGVSMLNPINLARIVVLLKMDVSALMGYTGAVFKDFFGSTAGQMTAGLLLIIWAFVPAWLAGLKFKTKDL